MIQGEHDLATQLTLVTLSFPYLRREGEGMPKLQKLSALALLRVSDSLVGQYIRTLYDKTERKKFNLISAKLLEKLINPIVYR
jgi:hypothetical protein